MWEKETADGLEVNRPASWNDWWGQTKPKSSRNQLGRQEVKVKDAEISDSGGEQFGGEEGASQVAQW